MREDHASWWLPEVYGKIAFTPGLTDLVKARLAPQTAHDALTAGRRYGPAEALQERIADAVVPAGELLPKAVAIAEELSHRHAATYGAIKSRLYRDVLASLRDREANHADISKFQPAFELVGVRSAPGEEA
jgi:enoyl-CoA hydratase/carnithine racemase